MIWATTGKDGEKEGRKLKSRSKVGIQKRVLMLLRNLAGPLAVSIFYPLLIYYGFRAIGIKAFTALILGAIPIAAFQINQLLRKRQNIIVGCFVLVVLSLSIVMAFVTGDERFLLAKAGFFTAAVAGCFLVSLFSKKPVAYTIAAFLLQKMEVSGEHLESLWDGIPRFRRAWKTSTLVWGLGILMNAVLILVMSYLLPVDIVPVLNTVVNFILFVVLQLITQHHYKKKGVWKLIFNSGMRDDFSNR